MLDRTINASVIKSTCGLTEYATRQLLTDPALTKSFTKRHGPFGGNGTRFWALRVVLPVLRRRTFFNEAMERELINTDHVTREVSAVNNETDAYTVREGLSRAETERLERNVVPEFRVALAEIYGEQLHPTMLDALVRGLSNNASVYHYLVSGGTLEFDPMDREQMRTLARTIVDGDPLAVRCIEMANATRRRELEAAFLASLKPGEALKMDRAGILADRIAAYVEEMLDARCAK